MLRRTGAFSIAVGVGLLGCSSSGGEDAGGRADAGAQKDAGGSIDDPSCQVNRTLSLEESRALVPFAAGNRWMYRGRTEYAGVTTDEYSTDTVALDPTTQDGQVVQPLRTTTNGGLEKSFEEYYRIDETGLYNHGNTDGGDSVTSLVAPYRAMKFPVAVCTTFDAFHVVVDLGYDLDGDGKSEALGIGSRVWLRGFEDVETVLGRFPDSLRVERTVASTTRMSLTMESSVREETSVSWLAPGVGLVKRSTARSQDAYSFHEELIGFDVDDEARGPVLLGSLASGLAEPSSDERQVGRPAVASDGARFLVVVRDDTPGTLRGLFVSTQGVIESSFDLGVDGRMPVLAYDGENYLLVYQSLSSLGIDGMRISGEGARLGAPFHIISGGVQFNSAPALAFGGDTFLVVYSRGEGFQDDVFASRISRQGVVLGETLVSGGPGNQTSPSVDFDGEDFFVVWQDARNDLMDGTNTDIYAARVSIQGEVVDPDGIAVASTSAPELIPDVAFDGANHVVAWFEARILNFIGDGDIRGARVRADGTLLDGPASSGGFAINTNDHGKNNPRVVRFDPGVLVVWELPSFSGVAGILGARFDSNGQLVGAAPTDDGLWVSGMPSSSTASLFQFPALAALPDRSLVTWVDNVEGGGTKSLQATMLFPW